jgi:ADP-ribose pyrophosphatase YjhB (NUDIX family)
MRFEPHVTVATVVEKDGKFLFVEEGSKDALVLNQPAGHLEPNESLLEAAVRETLEETQWHIELDSYLGVSLFDAPNGVTYVRHSFCAEAITMNEHIDRDKDIHQILWLTKKDALNRQDDFRSPLVLLDLERFFEGVRMPLSSITRL